MPRHTPQAMRPCSRRLEDNASERLSWLVRWTGIARSPVLRTVSARSRISCRITNGRWSSIVRREQLFSALGDDRGEAQTQLHQGHVYSDLGRLRRGASLLRSGPGPVGAGRRQTTTSDCQGRQRTTGGAARKLSDGVESVPGSAYIAGAMGDAVWEGSSLTGIAWVYRRDGRTDQALKHWERALQLFEAAGLKIFAVEVLMSPRRHLSRRRATTSRALAASNECSPWPTNWILRGGRRGRSDTSVVVHLVRRHARSGSPVS